MTEKNLKQSRKDTKVNFKQYLCDLPTERKNSFFRQAGLASLRETKRLVFAFDTARH